jgi:hypothetical protein
MSLEHLTKQYNFLHNLLDKLEDQCQLWIEKQEITSAYASSIVNLINQQNDTKSFMRKNTVDTTIKQGNKIYPRNYVSDFVSNGTSVVSFLPPLEFQSTYEEINNDIKGTEGEKKIIVNTREKSNMDFACKYDVELQQETPAIISFLSYYPNVIEKLLIKQQYNVEETIKSFIEEASNFCSIKEIMVKIRHDAKNSVRMAYRKAMEMDSSKPQKEEIMKEKVIDKMNSMEKANIPLVDLEMWIDKIVTCYEREWGIKEFLIKRLREGSLSEMSDWDNWNSRWNSQSYLDFELEQDVRDKIKAYKLTKIYEREKEKDI